MLSSRNLSSLWYYVFDFWENGAHRNRWGDGANWSCDPLEILRIRKFRSAWEFPSFPRRSDNLGAIYVVSYTGFPELESDYKGGIAASSPISLARIVSPRQNLKTQLIDVGIGTRFGKFVLDCFRSLLADVVPFSFSDPIPSWITLDTYSTVSLRRAQIYNLRELSIACAFTPYF